MKKDKINFRLILITDKKLAGKDFLKIIKKSSECGVKAIQLREKKLPAAVVVTLANSIKKIIQQHTKLIINERLDIALLTKAEGIHSPVNGIIRKYIPSELIAGKSVHSKLEAVKAEKEGYDYILFGPVFRTPAKIKYGSPQGLDKLSDICKSVSIPVFAVGGISPKRVKKCLYAGAYGVAVIRAVMKSNDARKTINEFKSELGGL